MRESLEHRGSQNKGTILPYAGLWPRFLALAVDFALFLALFLRRWMRLEPGWA